MLNANILRTMMVGLIVEVSAAGCGSSLGGRSDGGRADAARDRSSDRPPGTDAARDGNIDARRDGDATSGHGTGKDGDPCDSNADCACGFHCLMANMVSICVANGSRGDPCTNDCDCGDDVCHPNNGYPVCQPPDAGLCVPGGCDDTHPCCHPGDLCCRYLEAPDHYSPGTCTGLC